MAKLVFAWCVVWGLLFLSAYPIDGETVDQTLCQPNDPRVNVNINFVNGSCETSRCQSNPCLYGSECVTIHNYTCLNCPFPMGGKNCQELKCDTFCFRHKDTVYFAYGDHPSTWTQAYRHCMDKGMTLAIIKDTATHHVVKQNLLALYSDRASTKHAFWIGLRRFSKGDPWKWVDGTTLDYKDGWAPDRPMNDLCVNIANGGPFHFSMDDDPCDKYPGWEYFPLCQQTFAFLVN